MEPQIHSHVTDVLPDDHPLAFETVYCDCTKEHENGEMLHCGNNECMQTWIEFCGFHICVKCFIKYLEKYDKYVLEAEEFRQFVTANKN